ncbi:MAG: glycosyltransferase [Jaaginema sp. PMC 1079.18]|nr:glycosyltransferase [Jaaginema sp. PMC 1080.18]MEC4853608.1 glycosyltransferase [Jaaginema sp. PMC 1079.18]MEC4868316.1 glycosyltransferase [Jaaginema sp. PMC 1078.18]
MSSLGLVAIGRNEGDRLRQCLQSVRDAADTVVYVDSGSTDGSLEMARSLGVTVVELDLNLPFTAARARNAGFERLLQLTPNLDFVQFVDGDCEVVAGWLDTARTYLETHPQIAVVCGRRRERFPDQTPYNRLCDIEWDTPVGEAKACGGDAMMRVKAVQQVGGYNPNLIAGEEPELCVRLRQQGWQIWRIAAEMTRHDAQMTRWGQWWKRSQRAGHAFAEGAWLHGSPPERHWVKESRSIWLWGVIIPVVALSFAWLSHGWSLLLLLGYPLLLYRVLKGINKPHLNPQSTRLYALSCVVGKFPQALGQIQFHLNRLLGRQQQLIEYKTPTPE